MNFKQHPHRFLLHMIWAGPLTWMMIIPSVILDIFIEIYHHTTFPTLGIPLVPRSRYIKIDRHKLAYLNWVEKINCMYCGYVNGLYLYATVIAAQTEQYWCGIQHDKYKDFVAPAHHKDFTPYDNEKKWQNKYEAK